jgi:hypothetical protein
MSVDWSATEQKAISAIKDVLSGAWGDVATGASAQVKALVSIGASVEAAIQSDPPSITQSDYQALLLSAQRALDGVLQTYEAVGIVIAEQAAAAAVNVVVTALKQANPAIAFL